MCKKKLINVVNRNNDLQVGDHVLIQYIRKWPTDERREGLRNIYGGAIGKIKSWEHKSDWDIEVEIIDDSNCNEYVEGKILFMVKEDVEKVYRIE